MSTSTTQTVPAETDADRAAKVIAGKSQPASKRNTSRTSRAAAKSAADSKPKPAPKPSAAKPAKPSEPTKSELQLLVFAELMRAAGDIVDNPPKGVTKTQAREILAARQRVGDARIWGRCDGRK
jgi:hypothetical protein